VVRKIYQSVVILLVLILGSHAYAQNYIPGELLVHLRPGTSINQFNQNYGTWTLASSSFNTSYRLAIPANANVQAFVTRMSSDNRVLSVSPNLRNADKGKMPAVPVLQWISSANGDGNALPILAQLTQPFTQGVNYGPIASRYSGEGVTVAILDTGISRRNPALAYQVTTGWNFVNNTANTDDVPQGTDSNQNMIPDQAVGHGTMVAGIVAHFAPHAKLLPVRVLDSDGEGTLWATVEGIHYAISKGARVLNLSFGSTQRSQLLADAIAEASANNALVISSAGNDNSSQPNYPADIAQAINVAAVNNQGVKAAFSNYGASVDLDAPGVSIVSTYWNGGYAIWSGTSFAAPMVSAEAALVLSAKPDMTALALRQRLLASSHSIDSRNPKYVGMLGKNGAGMIDMDLALSGL